MSSGEVGDQAVAFLGEDHAYDPRVLRVRDPAHDAGRLRAVHEPDRAVSLQQQVAGYIPDGRGLRPGMALDRHEQLVLYMGQADRGGLLLAPVLEAAQFDPERQDVLKILSGCLNGIAS